MQLRRDHAAAPDEAADAGEAENLLLEAEKAAALAELLALKEAISMRKAEQEREQRAAHVRLPSPRS